MRAGAALGRGQVLGLPPPSSNCAHLPNTMYACAVKGRTLLGARREAELPSACDLSAAAGPGAPPAAIAAMVGWAAAVARAAAEHARAAVSCVGTIGRRRLRVDWQVGQPGAAAAYGGEVSHMEGVWKSSSKHMHVNAGSAHATCVHGMSGGMADHASNPTNTVSRRRHRTNIQAAARHSWQRMPP